jgi:hypothetical protein
MTRNDSVAAELAKDMPVAVVAGYLGTKFMEPISQKLYELESEEDRKREDAVRPGPPFEIAAEKTAKLAGVELNNQQKERLGLFFHYGLAVGWAPVYALLRRRTALSPLAAALASGAAMWLVADEGMTPALGFSAPNRAYPLSTHLRGFAAHLAFGLGVGAVTEAVWRVTRRAPAA